MDWYMGQQHSYLIWNYVRDNCSIGNHFFWQHNNEWFSLFFNRYDHRLDCCWGCGKLEFPGNWQFYRNHFWSVDIRELLGDLSRCMLRRYWNFLSHKYVMTLPTLLMKADAVLQKVFSGSAVQYNYSRADAVS
jgi:hypothetical protein